MTGFTAVDFMVFIQSPLNQLYIFLCIWLVNYVVKWRSEEYVMSSGALILCLWELGAVILGISGSIVWMYYLYLAGALLGGFLVYILSLAISDKWGVPYNGEGAVLILAPAFIFPVLVGPAALIKFIIQLFS